MISSSKRLLLVCCIFCVGSNIFSQNCRLSNWGNNHPFYFPENDSTKNLYDQIVVDSSAAWHFLLVDHRGLLGSQTVKYLKMDSVKLLYSSGSKSFFVETQGVEQLAQILDTSNNTNGFFTGSCSNVISYHGYEFLLVKNDKWKTWIEIFATNGSLMEILGASPEHTYLKNIYSFIEKLND